MPGELLSAQYVLPAVGVVLLLMFGGAALVKLWPAVSKAVRVIDTLQDLPERLQRIERSVGIVRGEVTHNGGSSLKDSVRRVETGQGAQDARIDRLEATIRRHYYTDE